MAEKHPYISGTAGIAAALTHFRKSLPGKVNAETLKKLGIAPNNESYVINILRFIGVIDADGAKSPKAAAAFSKHDDKEFQKSFAEMVKSAYAELFQLHGDNSWTLGEDKLVSFFRGSDQTSDLVGRRQATTFKVLASFAGHGEIPTPKSSTPKSSTPKQSSDKKSASKVKPTSKTEKAKEAEPDKQSNRDFGLTVRIEVNLPGGADQDTYDRIFRSIRENLLNGK